MKEQSSADDLLREMWGIEWVREAGTGMTSGFIVVEVNRPNQIETSEWTMHDGVARWSYVAFPLLIWSEICTRNAPCDFHAPSLVLQAVLGARTELFRTGSNRKKHTQWYGMKNIIRLFCQLSIQFVKNQ